MEDIVQEEPNTKENIAQDEEEKYLFHHWRLPGIRSAVTFAMEYSDEDKRVHYSYSLCSPRDQFCKKKGRMIAVNRLEHPDKERVSSFPLVTDGDGSVLKKATPKLHVQVRNDFLRSVHAKRRWIRPATWLKKMAKMQRELDYRALNNKAYVDIARGILEQVDRQPYGNILFGLHQLAKFINARVPRVDEEAATIAGKLVIE